ncbi:chondroadherin-like b [Lepisosteus oculatus]|uniref:chondroadherin-like b n=1 Tax=Lepisosteus oculatus TaxID=7918 RepID=UPI0035F51080
MRKAHQSTENDKIEIRMRAPARRAFVSPVWLTAVLLLGAAGAESRRCPRPCICDHIQLTVSCLKRNLTEVPPTLPEVTKKLDLRGNDIRELRTGGFLRTPYLTHLTLQRCNIETVQEGAFRGLGRLLFLSLADNRISILYQESFDGLSSLKQLLVDRNRVEELQPGAFAQLGFLNLLSLAENFLVYLPDVVFQGLCSLRWLRLSHNALNTLGQEAFAGLLALQRLSLDHNELQFFPTEPLTRLPELTRLDLGWNPMTYLGEEAVAVPRLRQLFLDHMSLQDVSPAALQRAPALALLDLSHNQLRALQPLGGPERLGRLNLTGNPVLCSCSLRPLRDWADRRRARLAGACAGPPHLAGEGLDAVEPGQLRCVSQEALERAEREERLLGATPRPVPDTAPARCPAGCECQADTQHSSCEGRGHTKIPKGFPADTRLLDLRGNRFHHVPRGSFPGLGAAVSLHLQRCGIRELAAGALAGLRSLVYLYLSENELSELDPGALRGLPQLAYLHLERNRLAAPPAAALGALPRLLSLHLQRNAIARLGEGALAGAGGLRALYLEGNALEGLHPGALRPAPGLETLHLGANQLAEVPTAALHHAPSLAELRLSGNPIRWVGPGAFLPLAGSLRHLHLANMGLEKLSRDALQGLGSGLRSLWLEGNQLEGLPSLDNLTGLEVINLAGNPLMCDCPLLPLRKWIEKVNLKVRASCGNPPEIRGQLVKDVHVFKSCPGEVPPPQSPRNAQGPKPLVTKSTKGPKPKPQPARAPKPSQGPSAAALKTAGKKKAAAL